jgi:hypothetical protein
VRPATADASTGGTGCRGVANRLLDRAALVASEARLEIYQSTSCIQLTNRHIVVMGDTRVAGIVRQVRAE